MIVDSAWTYTDCADRHKNLEMFSGNVFRVYSIRKLEVHPLTSTL